MALPVCCYKRALKEEEGLFWLLPFGALLWALGFGLFTWLLAFCLGGFLPLNIGKKLLL
jgi:hypothetical protein